MGLFSRKKTESKNRTIVGDGIDLNPFTSYDNLGWKVVNDEQDYDALHNETKHNAIARRIVHKPAEDATRNGFRVIIADDPERQKMYQRLHDNLKTAQALSQQVIYQREGGDGYITIGVNENDDADSSTLHSRIRSESC